jgi:hypothetical protein
MNILSQIPFSENKEMPNGFQIKLKKLHFIWTHFLVFGQTFANFLHFGHFLTNTMYVISFLG